MWIEKEWKRNGGDYWVVFAPFEKENTYGLSFGITYEPREPRYNEFAWCFHIDVQILNRSFVFCIGRWK